MGLTRRFYNLEDYGKIDFQFPIFEEDKEEKKNLDASIPSIDVKKNMFGTTSGKIFDARSDENELKILKNAAISKKPFYLIIKTKNKKESTLPVKIEKINNDKEEFKVELVKTSNNSITGHLIISTKLILNLTILSDNKIKIILNSDSLNIKQ